MKPTAAQIKIGSAIAVVALFSASITNIDKFVDWWNHISQAKKAYAMSQELEDTLSEYIAVSNEREKAQRDFYQQQMQQQMPVQQYRVEVDRRGKAYCTDGVNAWRFNKYSGCNGQRTQW